MTALIATVNTPVLNSSRDITRYEIGFECTIRQWLAMTYGDDFDEFDRPTICTVNGVPVKRAEWFTYQIKDSDTVLFISTAGDAFSIIMAVIALVVAIASYLMIPDPVNPDNDQGESVFTLKGQKNRMRLGEPIECVYGRCRLFPSYVAPPYTRYIDNEAYQYSWLLLSQGELAVEDDTWAIDDTPITSFEGVEIEMLPPGQTPTLFNGNVFQSPEVGNIELLGPNEEAYAGVSGPFIINPANSRITMIEVDITFPQGLYETDEEDGGRESASVGYKFEVMRISDTGAELSGWSTLVAETKSLKTATPQRFSLSGDVPEGRWQIRGVRTSNKDGDAGVASTLFWESVKGYSLITTDVGNVTTIAYKVKASNSLNNNTRGMLNVFATRKLPIWNPTTGEWSAPTATRNGVDALCDMFRATYGAELPDMYLDLAYGLADLREQIESSEDWFDHVFDQRGGLWDAAKLVMKTARAVPIPQGSLITAVRDNPATLPSAIFNQNNIVAGSVVKQLNLFEFQEYNAVAVQYTDPLTWKPEEVVCYLPGVTPHRIEKIILAGCTDRNKAYQWGMYFRARRQWQRKTITFRTGLEGHLPTYMDLVAVAHQTVRVGFGGMILAYDSGTKEAILSDAVRFDDNFDSVIGIRASNGGINGEPIVCTPGSAPNRVILETDPETELDFSPDQNPPFFVFGTVDKMSFLGKVVDLKPSGDEVELVVLNYDKRIYNFTESTTPPLISGGYIGNPQAPTVLAVRLEGIIPFNGTGTASWTPTPGAIGYRVEYSQDDGTTWGLIGETSAPSMPVVINIGDNQVRVAAYSPSGRGLWTYSNIFQGLVIGEFSLVTDDGQAITDDNNKQITTDEAP